MNKPEWINQYLSITTVWIALVCVPGFDAEVTFEDLVQILFLVADLRNDLIDLFMVSSDLFFGAYSVIKYHLRYDGTKERRGTKEQE